VRSANYESGGGVIEISGHEQVIRGRGYVRNLAGSRARGAARGRARRPGLPARRCDRRVRPRHAPGLVELDGEGEAVGGIVVMRWGENALAVIDAVKERLESVRAGLPEGVEIVTTYDRSELIRAAIATLRHTLLEEMLVVSLVIFVFLLHARSALIPILTIPIGDRARVRADALPGPRREHHVTRRHRRGDRCDGRRGDHRGREHPQEARGVGGGRSPGDRGEVILHAMQEVGPSIFFALLVITVSFLPIFALEGTEGRLFKPLAFTKTYAMGFAAVLSVTLTPALAALLIPRQDPRRARQPGQPLARVELCARRAVGGPPARVGRGRSAAPARHHGARRSSRSDRSSCRRSTRARCSTCRPRRPGSRSARRRGSSS
jgi:Cu(I)/Ag(I) efflux system membrane protein CusA/SilA